MEMRGIPRAVLAIAAVGLAILAGIGTAGSFGDDGSLWGDHYEPDSPSAASPERDAAVLRGPAIRTAVESVTTAYARAVNDGEHDAAASLYAADAVTSRPGVPAAEGRATIRRSLERAFPTGTTLQIASADVQVLSPEWASVYGSASVAPAGNDGAEATGGKRSVTLFALLRKGDDGWRVVREAVSSNR